MCNIFAEIFSARLISGPAHVNVEIFLTLLIINAVRSFSSLSRKILLSAPAPDVTDSVVLLIARARNITHRQIVRV